MASRESGRGRSYAGGVAEISRWRQPPEKTTNEPAPAGAAECRQPHVSAAPAGAGLILSSIRWFPLADSLHHRLISAAPPAHSRCPISVVYRTAFSVGRLGQHFHDLQHGIRQPRAEHESLVLRKAIHAVQHPFHVVIPFRQSDRQVRRGQAFLAQKNSPGGGGASCSRAQ